MFGRAKGTSSADGPDRGRGAGADPLETWEELLRAIKVVPVPGARPSYSRADEAAGFTILALALQMNHVHRVSEEVAVDDRTHMRRSVSVDIDLRRIDAVQRAALAERPLGPLADGEPGVPRIWIPVARQSRGDLASVAIRDESGDVVPRLTSSATQRALIAGLTRLLKNQIRASEGRGKATPASVVSPVAAETQQTHEAVGALSQPDDLQSRWLIERAVAQCVERGQAQVWRRLELEVPDAEPSVDSADADGPERSNLTPVQLQERREQGLGLPHRVGQGADRGVRGAAADRRHAAVDHRVGADRRRPPAPALRGTADPDLAGAAAAAQATARLGTPQPRVLDRVRDPYPAGAQRLPRVGRRAGGDPGQTVLAEHRLGGDRGQETRCRSEAPGRSQGRRRRARAAGAAGAVHDEARGGRPRGGARRRALPPGLAGQAAHGQRHQLPGVRRPDARTVRGAFA